MEAKKSSKALDLLLFLISTAIMLALLVFADSWFWIPLPFALTFLARALDVL